MESLSVSISFNNSGVDPEPMLEQLRTEFPGAEISYRPDCRRIGSDIELAELAVDLFHAELASVETPYEVGIRSADEGFEVSVKYSDENAEAVIRAVLKVCSECPGVVVLLNRIKAPEQH